MFGAAALAVFLGLGALFYRRYGNVFLHEAFLYHASRHDPRHNFSPHFLFTYLFRFGPTGPDGGPVVPDVHLALNPGAIAPVCMALALLATSLAYWEDLDMSWLLCSIVFVAFNKVSTAQYFVWYMGIIPVAIPHLMPAWRATQWICVGVWVSFQLLWLSQAYRLEFLVRIVALPC
jgi:GPI mannosyltransferase 1 subunit M